MSSKPGTRRSSWIAVALMAFAGSALADPPANPGRCNGADIANGPFQYSDSAGSATFQGAGGSPASGSFTVTAPSVAKNTAAEDTFTAEGQDQDAVCPTSASAAFRVFEVTKVGDADGNLIAPEAVTGTLYDQIAGSFSFSPAGAIFTPGSSVAVAVTVSNPEVGLLDYGDYELKLAAQAPGAGIGVGSGAMFALTVKADAWTDTTPPTVTVTKPTGDEILGVVGIEITAVDPEPGTGVASMGATISSAGGAVSGQPIALTPDQGLPVAAGVLVTATGSFTPTGATGPAGTTDAAAFTTSARSGIGTYTINAEATDAAGNTGSASKTFGVKYAVTFTQQFAASNCTTRTGTSGAQCTGMYSFTAARSNVTSDGALMYDHTVVVDLVRTSDGTIAASHVYGTGAIHGYVQLDATTAVYKTHFKRGDFGVALPGTYVAKVYFMDVDGNMVLQGTSGQLTF